MLQAGPAMFYAAGAAQDTIPTAITTVRQEFSSILLMSLVSSTSAAG